MAPVHLPGTAGITERQRRKVKNDRSCQRVKRKQRGVYKELDRLSNIVHSLQKSVNGNSHDHYKRSSNSNNNGYDGSKILNNCNIMQHLTSLNGNSPDEYNGSSNSSKKG